MHFTVNKKAHVQQVKPQRGQKQGCKYMEHCFEDAKDTNI